MNNELLEEIIKLTEALVSKANIYGDEANTKIAVIPGNLSNTGQNILIIVVQDTIMYSVPLKTPYYNTNVYGAGAGIHMYGLDNYDQFIATDIYNKYTLYTNTISGKLPLAYDNELRNNDEFEKLLGLKSSQGMRYYNLADYNSPGLSYLIPMFAGFINLNKDDRIGIKIYDFDPINHLINFSIYKKKINRDVQMYCRTLKI